MISFDKVTKVFQRNWTVLQDVSFELNKGEFLFISGPTGAGKSTILKIIYKDEEPTRGMVKVFDQNIKLLKPRGIPMYRRKLGVVFQDFKLLHDRTLEENIAFALEVTDYPARDIRRKVMELLTYLRLTHKRYYFPYQLSGGEQQKTTIARALVRDPYILLADEPTGNLDARSSLEILDILLDLNYKGTTIVMASHNLSLIKRAKKRHIRLEDGKIIHQE